MLANLEVPEQVRPIGVTAIAMLFFLSATYIAALGGIMLLAPGTVPMMLGAPLLFGLELAGPYMFLLLAAAGALIGWGLFRLSNLARRAAAIVAVLGVVMLVPSVSANVITLQWKGLFFGGLGVIVRVMIAWYLWQRPVVEAFEKR